MDGAGVVGVEPVGQGPAHDLGRLEAEDPGDRRALVDDPDVAVDDGDDVARVLGQRPEPGLGAGHVLEGGAGQGGDELGQLDLVLAEQVARPGCG